MARFIGEPNPYTGTSLSFSDLAALPDLTLAGVPDQRPIDAKNPSDLFDALNALSVPGITTEMSIEQLISKLAARCELAAQNAAAAADAADKVFLSEP